MADETAAEVPFLALCLDGGGARGLYTIALLENLAHHFSQTSDFDIGSCFDLIAGTSTGGILACGLAAGVPTSKIRNLYEEHGSKIFTAPAPAPSESPWWWVWRHRSRPAGDGEALASVLEATFGSQTLRSVWEARHIALCIPATHMAGQRSCWVFKTPHDPAFTRDGGTLLSDVCRATSAAPIVLPLAKVQDHRDQTHSFVFVDGGLWANNPVLVALIEALLLAGPKRPIHLLSLGTSAANAGLAIDRKHVNWGLGNWKFGVGALSASLEAQSSGQYEMARLLAQHLQRDISIVRIDFKSASADQAQHLAMDRSDERAVTTLKDLARTDADTALSKHRAREAEWSLLGSFFEPGQ